MTTSGMETGAEQARKPTWTRHLLTGAVGLGLLIAFAALRHGGGPVLAEQAEDVFLHDLGIALVLAVLVAFLFDTTYHDAMVTKPMHALWTVVHRSTTDFLEITESAKKVVENTVSDMKAELASRDAALKTQYEETMGGFSLLSRSNVLGIVGLYSRNQEFKHQVCMAVRSAEQHCWIVGRTHKEMLGAQDEGKGWLVDELDRTLERKLKKPTDNIKDNLKDTDPPAFTLRILLANPFDPVLEPSQTGIERDSKSPRTRNPAREAVHGLQEARKAIYQLLNVLKNYSEYRCIEVKLLRASAVPYCMLMTERRMFVEHYLPSREGGALSITEIEPRDTPREQAPYDCFKSDSWKLFECGEDCEVVLERFRERRFDQYFS